MFSINQPFSTPIYQCDVIKGKLGHGKGMVLPLGVTVKTRSLWARALFEEIHDSELVLIRHDEDCNGSRCPKPAADGE